MVNTLFFCLPKPLNWQWLMMIMASLSGYISQFLRPCNTEEKENNNGDSVSVLLAANSSGILFTIGNDHTEFTNPGLWIGDIT
jgi:hypothetical protein